MTIKKYILFLPAKNLYFTLSLYTLEITIYWDPLDPLFQVYRLK